MAGIVLLTMLFLVFRLYTVQVVQGEKYRERASAQYTQTSGATNERGSISFTTKDGTKRTAALQESGSLLAVNGRTILSPQTAYSQLKNIVDIDRQEFLDSVTNTDDPYIVIKERLPSAVGDRINDLGIDGVRAYPQKWRQYPLGSLASHVLGFVGHNASSTAPTGIYGTEDYRNNVLLRNPGGVYTNFFARVFSQPEDTIRPDARSQSGNVNLTIEPDVQAYLEKQITDAKRQWNATQIMGVVINPSTGAIRAMATKPDYNPNRYEQVDNTDVFTNPVVRSRYEMGSIIKALTMSAGLDAEVVSPETTYNDTGEITLDEATIANYDGVSRGVVDMQTVLNQSLNTGAAFIADRLGHNRMRTYFRDWFKGKTDIDLPGEIGNDISNLKVDRELEFATAAFGQGISLTPISTVRALSTLANGGKLVRPHVTKSIDYQFGGSSQVAVKPGKQVIEPESAETISRMLATVVDEALPEWSRERHSIAAKTGTAQVPKPGGGYYDNTYNHTFFGYFPAYQPRFLVFLMARRPEGRFASQTLVKPFMRMTDFLINYYNIPPDR